MVELRTVKKQSEFVRNQTLCTTAGFMLLNCHSLAAFGRVVFLCVPNIKNKGEIILKLIYDVADKPKFSKTLVFAFQQMIAIMAATLLVPMLITSFGLNADPAAALFGAGIGTIVYLAFTKRKSPVFLGSSFTFLGAYAASIGQNYGYWGMIIGVTFAGLVYVVIGLIIKVAGTKWVN